MSKFEIIDEPYEISCTQVYTFSIEVDDEDYTGTFTKFYESNNAIPVYSIEFDDDENPDVDMDELEEALKEKISNS